MLGYGAGDIGFNLYWTGLSVYLLFYYTDVLGIEPLTAGLIFSISIFWDAITDPLMGYIATRTRTRWGRFRPYILLGAPFMGISFVMMFAAPIIFPSALVLSSAAAHVLFRTLFTIVSIPYSSLSAVLTTDSRARNKLAGFRMLGAIVGGLLAIVLMPILAAELGGENVKLGWAWVSVIFAVIATLLIGLVFITSQEDTNLYDPEQRLPLADSLKFITANRALWFVCAAMIVTTVSQSVAGKSIVYIIKYNFDAESQTGAILGLQTLGAAISLPFWIWLANRTSKRFTWALGACGLGVWELLLYLFTPSGVTLLGASLFVVGFLFGAAIVMFWSMIPDTVEYGQWRSGIRDEGMAFSMATFSQKAGVGIGVGLLGVFLQKIGYVADVEQTRQSLEGLRQASFLLPSLCGFMTATIIVCHPLGRDTHAEILTSIAAQREAAPR